jgi:hypothetical protein
LSSIKKKIREGKENRNEIKKTKKKRRRRRELWFRALLKNISILFFVIFETATFALKYTHTHTKTSTLIDAINKYNKKRKTFFSSFLPVNI